MGPKLGILVHSLDNVVTVAQAVETGDAVTYRLGGADQAIQASCTVPFGHKIAIRDIGRGEAVVKHGQVIGVASKPILAGDHVHVHNVRSPVQGVRA